MVVLRIALLLGLAWLLWRGYSRLRSGGQNRPENHLGTVRCERCGVFVSEDEAVRKDGHCYCRDHAPSD